MNTQRPVLATTDGSSRSHRVLPHAAALAKALGAPLLLLQVAEDEAAGARAQKQSEATLSRLGLSGDAVSEIRGRDEKVSAALLRAMQQRDAVALAMDSRGHGALRHVVHGSVALDLLRAAEVPVLVSGPNVEPLPPAGAPYHVLAACDGSEAAEAALRAMAALPGAEGLLVTLLRVHETEPYGKDNDAALRACEARMEEARGLLPAPMRVQTEVREIPRMAGIDTAIMEKAREVGAHAIAMSTHGHSARRHVVMGSVAMTTLGRSPLPLLLVRAAV